MCKGSDFRHYPIKITPEKSKRVEAEKNYTSITADNGSTTLMTCLMTSTSHFLIGMNLVFAAMHVCGEYLPSNLCNVGKESQNYGKL